MSIYDNLNEIPEDRKKLNNHRLYIVYEGKLDKKEYVEFLDKVIPAALRKKTVISHELLNAGEMVLTHILLALAKETQKAPKAFVFKENIPSIYSIKNAQSEEKCLEFLSSVDKENISWKPKGKGEGNEVRDILGKNKSTMDAVLNAKNIRDVPAIIQAMEFKKTVLEPFKLPNLRKYQKSIIELTQDRTPEKYKYVTCVVDVVGQKGKTDLLTYLCTNYRGWYLESEAGPASDVSYLIKSAIDRREWDGKVFLLDVPRSYKINDDLGKCLESVSNGKGLSKKYKSATWYASTNPNDRPRTVMFMNFFPKISLLTNNRWRLLALVNYDLYDITEYVLKHQYLLSYTKEDNELSSGCNSLEEFIQKKAAKFPDRANGDLFPVRGVKFSMKKKNKMENIPRELPREELEKRFGNAPELPKPKKEIKKPIQETPPSKPVKSTKPPKPTKEVNVPSYILKGRTEAEYYRDVLTGKEKKFNLFDYYDKNGNPIRERDEEGFFI